MFSRIWEYPSWSVNKQYIAMQSRQLISFDLNRKASWTLMTIKLLWHDLLLCSFCSLHQPVGQYGFQIMVIVYMFLEQQMLFPMCFWMSLALYSLLYQFQYCYCLSQVWDNMIIESALKTFYSSDLATMIRAIQNNITVYFSF
jgi:hypothetical protein